MKAGSSEVKKLLAGKVFAVGVVILFIVSGMIATIAGEWSGAGWAVERGFGEKLGRVTESGRGEGKGKGTHGKWTEGRGGSNKGENITHCEEDEFGGSWFDGFENGSAINISSLDRDIKILII